LQDGLLSAKLPHWRLKLQREALLDWRKRPHESLPETKLSRETLLDRRRLLLVVPGRIPRGQALLQANTLRRRLRMQLLLQAPLLERLRRKQIAAAKPRSRAGIFQQQRPSPGRLQCEPLQRARRRGRLKWSTIQLPLRRSQCCMKVLGGPEVGVKNMEMVEVGRSS